MKHWWSDGFGSSVDSDVDSISKALASLQRHWRSASQLLAVAYHTEDVRGKGKLACGGRAVGVRWACALMHTHARHPSLIYITILYITYLCHRNYMRLISIIDLSILSKIYMKILLAINYLELMLKFFNTSLRSCLSIFASSIIFSRQSAIRNKTLAISQWFSSASDLRCRFGGGNSSGAFWS